MRSIWDKGRSWAGQWIIRTEIEIRIFVYFNQEELDICSLLIDLKVDAYQELNATVYAANINFSNEKCSFETKIVIL